MEDEFDHMEGLNYCLGPQKESLLLSQYKNPIKIYNMIVLLNYWLNRNRIFCTYAHHHVRDFSFCFFVYPLFTLFFLSRITPVKKIVSFYFILAPSSPSLPLHLFPLPLSSTIIITTYLHPNYLSSSTRSSSSSPSLLRPPPPPPHDLHNKKFITIITTVSTSTNIWISFNIGFC